MRWRNGVGTTAEVAREPQSETDGPFDWRVSLASIDRPGTFSTYPNVDRILMPLGAAAVLLNVAGVETLLVPTSQLSFAGDDTVSAQLPDGSALALNLMVRRGGPSGYMTLVSGDEQASLIPTAATVIVIAITAAVSVQETTGNGVIRLRRLDALRLADPRHLAVMSGVAVAIAIRPRPVPPRPTARERGIISGGERPEPPPRGPAARRS